jgi:hypothetical protein
MSNDRIINDKHIEDESKISFEISGYPNSASLLSSEVLNSVLKGVLKKKP